MPGSGAMNSRFVILLSVVAVLALPSTGQAGRRLYDFGVFLGGDKDRLNRSEPLPARAPVARAQRAPLPATSASGQRRKSEAPRARQGNRPIISELIGGAWIHDPGENNRESDSLDFNLEIIFNRIRLFDANNRFSEFLGTPRPVVGGSVNNKGKTNTVYAGFSWAYQFETGWFFNLAIGGVYHTGNLEQATRQCAAGEGCSLPGNRAFVNAREPTLGSAILFREGLDLGYRFGPHGVSIYASHISNAGLDNDNDGINFIGMRYSFAFDRDFRN
jgi:lipid A 3-O-deacylase